MRGSAAISLLGAVSVRHAVSDLTFLGERNHRGGRQAVLNCLTARTTHKLSDNALFRCEMARVPAGPPTKAGCQDMKTMASAVLDPTRLSSNARDFETALR